MNTLSIPEAGNSKGIKLEAMCSQNQLAEHTQANVFSPPYPRIQYPQMVELNSSANSGTAHNAYQHIKLLACEYIDHLIEENERLTHISRAFTVPTPLDFENEHYFEEVRNTEHHFPSDRFRQWLDMKQYEDYYEMNGSHENKNLTLGHPIVNIKQEPENQYI